MKAGTAISIIVALLLVFTALFDLGVAALLATVYLIAFTIHRLFFKKRKRA